MEEKKHAKFSASGSERWLNCPASIKFCEDIPDEPASHYAAEGTRAHELVEVWAKHVVTSRGGFVFPKGFPEKMKEPVKVAIDHLKATIKKYKKPDVNIETRVSLDYIHPEMFGTLDLSVLEHFGTLEVMDYKHGTGYAVEVGDMKLGRMNHNTQLIYYALGEAHRYDYNFENVNLTIIQPRAFHDDGPIRTQTLSMTELRGYEGLFKRGIDRCLSRNPKFFAGSWCRWCKGRSKCETFKKHEQSFAQSRAKNDFD